MNDNLEAEVTPERDLGLLDLLEVRMQRPGCAT